MADEEEDVRNKDTGDKIDEPKPDASIDTEPEPEPVKETRRGSGSDSKSISSSTRYSSNVSDDPIDPRNDGPGAGAWSQDSTDAFPEMVRLPDYGPTTPMRGQSSDALERAQEKYKHILRMHKAVSELHKMCMDSGVLVKQQARKIKYAENSVERSTNLINKAEADAKQAVKYNTAAQRKKVMIAVILIGLMVMIGGMLFGSLS